MDVRRGAGNPVAHGHHRRQEGRLLRLDGGRGGLRPARALALPQRPRPARLDRRPAVSRLQRLSAVRLCCHLRRGRGDPRRVVLALQHASFAPRRRVLRVSRRHPVAAIPRRPAVAAPDRNRRPRARGCVADRARAQAALRPGTAEAALPRRRRGAQRRGAARGAVAGVRCRGQRGIGRHDVLPSAPGRPPAWLRFRFSWSGHGEGENVVRRQSAGFRFGPFRRRTCRRRDRPDFTRRRIRSVAPRRRSLGHCPTVALSQPKRRPAMIPILDVVLPVFAIILAGYAAGRMGWLGEASSDALNRFVYYCALPALFFGSLARIEPARIFDPAFLAAYTGGQLAVFVAAFASARLLFKNSPAEASLFAMGGIFANSGYMGVPLALVAFGADGIPPTIVATVFMSMIFIALVTILIETDPR
ncbi:MAG: hypothetical protein FJX37_08970, partial [Alphaproteobacteria bacterium]|nr:hypothetical protein [Alphaproteobacteria bacterium]